MTDDVSLHQKFEAIKKVLTFRPSLTIGTIILSVMAAILEGIGLSFILPLVRQARGGSESDPGGLMEIFVSFYDFIGVPFTLEYIVLGVSAVITLRYISTFFVEWLRVELQIDYVRYLRTASYQGGLDAKIGYFDERGSDDIINAIITQSNYASGAVNRLINVFQFSLVALVYIALAVYLSPFLVAAALLILGGSTFLIRKVFKPGFSIGSKVAEANESIHGDTQAGMQGIRDVKLFGLQSEFADAFERTMKKWSDARIKQRRNTAGINNFQQLVSALSVFILIYLSLEYASLSLGSLGVFLFAMFRLAPRVSKLNDTIYNLETDLPHVVRSQQFVEDIERRAETSGDDPVPDRIRIIEFDSVSFAYGDEQVLHNISFEIDDGQFVAFVGQSGAGKSTIVSLLARMYNPDDGEIRANGRSIDEFDLQEWREHLAVVRQQPYIFNDTLRHNLTIGNLEASEDEIRRVAEISRVDEFLDEMPDGYETELGDEGVRLSGGQKQRVALARALLKDADILVLDEATSDLDRNIEAEVQQAIESMDRDYITITVAHRLSTVKNADRIYTVSEGEIVDKGTHEELLDEDAEYADLYSVQ